MNFELSYCLISLAWLAFVYFSLVASLRRETFRCQVRRIRDELFDFMWTTNRDFNDRAYRNTRQVFNGFLAGSNNVSLATLTGATLAAFFICWRRTEKAKADARLPFETEDAGLQGAIQVAYLALAFTLIDFAFLNGIHGVLIRSVWRGLTYVFRWQGNVIIVQRIFVAALADFLRRRGAQMVTLGRT